MEQPRSKDAGVNSSMMVSRGMIVKEDEGEDVVESPEGSVDRELLEKLPPLRDPSERLDGLRKKNPPQKDIDERRHTVFNQKGMNSEQP
jgi:ABC-type glutathione transport system ATPase component